MSKVRINQGRTIHGGFRYAASLALICGIITSFCLLNNIYGFLLTLLFGFLLFLLWSSFHIVEIDMQKKTVSDLTLVMGRKFGETITYDAIEYVYINAVNYKQATHNYGTGAVHTANGREFRAFLKFTNGENIFLVSDEDESALKERLQPVIKKLGTSIK